MLSYFVDVDFKRDSPGHYKSLSPHATNQVRLPKEGDIIFPLTRRYDLVNFTFEGVSGSVPTEGADFDLPDYDDGDPYKSGEDPTDPRDQGGADPTALPDDTVDRAGPFACGVDAMGRKYPRDKYGYRISPGSRRPDGIPPNIWRNLSKKDNAELTRASRRDEDATVASSNMVIVHPSDVLDCERFHDQWIAEFESYTSYPGGVDPTEHRPKLDLPMIPGACVCRPVDRKEVKANPAAERAIQQE